MSRLGFLGVPLRVEIRAQNRREFWILFPERAPEAMM
jgi:hypothetical protein